jgi:hypothetical protein
VIELSLKSWLIAGLVPGLARQPLKKQGADAEALLALLHRWRGEAMKVGSKIERVVVAFEVGRGGFWLARWLRVEAYVIHPTSIPVSGREYRAPACASACGSPACRGRTPTDRAAPPVASVPSADAPPSALPPTAE